MSDRCVFVPIPGRDNYEWADVVIPEGARVLSICRLARKFYYLPGPHRVFIASRDDPRFKIFQWYLSTRFWCHEDIRGYSVSEKNVNRNE